MKILIIQLRRIGDIIVTTPVIDALRRAHPGARIEFLAEEIGRPVLSNYPGLDEHIVFDKGRFFSHLLDIRRRRYDWVLDFMNNPRTAQIALASGAEVRAGFAVPAWGLAYNVRVPHASAPKYNVQVKFDLLRALGLRLPPGGVLPRIAVDEKDFAGAEGWWNSRGLGKVRQRIAVMPAHRRPIRQWPPGRFVELAEKLLAAPDRAILLFGGPGEEELLASFTRRFPKRVHQIPAGSLRQAAALLSLCHAAVTNDSGLMHLAVSVGTPTVTVYGPTWPENWNPCTPPHRAIRADGLACLGCNLDACPYGHECMEWISAERVSAEVEKTLAEAAA